MNDISIKKVGIGEGEDLKSIALQTFIETFAEHNTEADMNNYVEKNFSLNQIQKEILNDNSLFYFALLDGEVIGYLKMNKGDAQTEIKDDKSIEIERIYVLQAYHGKNVGQALYRYALQVGQQEKVDYIWLGVWEKNTRAIAFYKKNGFVEFDKHIFLLGNDKQTDIMMKLMLNS